jgi:hypothetical protein
MDKATIKQVKEYFGIESTPEFMKQWRALNANEQDFFKTEVGKVLSK